MWKYNPKHRVWEQEAVPDGRFICDCFVCQNAKHQALGYNYSKVFELLEKPG